MGRRLLCGSVLVGFGSLAAAPAAALEGIKLEVGGYFSSAYVGVRDGKHRGARWGTDRNADALKQDAEVQISGETKLDDGVALEARIELEGEGDPFGQIGKSWISASGDFGLIRFGSQDDALETQCPYVPGGTANFSAFSPTGWGSNDPIGSNTDCQSADDDAQKITYLTPVFSGFQLALSYTPSANGEDYTQAGVNNAGTPTNPDGIAHHIVSAYATYSIERDEWTFTWGGGGSWQLAYNGIPGFRDGRSAAYQTSGALSIGPVAVGAVFEYVDQGGPHNDRWVAGAGLAYYATEQLTFGLQYSHGRYDGDLLGDDLGTDGAHSLNRVVLTVGYNLAPGVDLDADLGYTWYRDTRSPTLDTLDDYQAAEIGFGSSFSF